MALWAECPFPLPPSRALQAIVGDKTVAFHLMDKHMYDGMSTIRPPGPEVARGIALHKVIRAATIAIGGEGWMNFMVSPPSNLYALNVISFLPRCLNKKSY